jgi:nicotinate-nucleotide--dimethylbenzimidazole phosphoribosyltransferase
MSTGHLQATNLGLHVGARTLIASLTQCFAPGEVWCIAGPNGAGKTTLIGVLAGLTRPAAGEVTLDGIALAGWRAADLARRRAWMPQDTHDGFSASVLDTVMLNRFPYLSGWGWESGDDRAAALAALDLLGLGSFAARDVLSLSGGERQRVALAATLCQNAPLVLLDEPLSHLDLHHQIECLEVLTVAARERARTVIFSCHDLNLARRFATHALLLDGRGGAHAGLARDVLSAARASAAFGYPLALIRQEGHEALVPALHPFTTTDIQPPTGRPMTLTHDLPRPQPIERALEAELRRVIDTKTKPPGSLGRLEALALQMGLIQRSVKPRIERPAMIVFAGDHGIAAEGVSSYPQEVTVQMVANFLAGGAAINALSRSVGMTLEVADAGVATALPAPGLVDIAIARGGTRNFAREPAMTRDETLLAMARGAERVRHHASLGTNVIGFGEMGIANTSAAACLMSRLCRLPIDVCVGRGTGLSNEGVSHKRAVLAAALEHHPATSDPVDTLATFGGFEIAMIAGAYLAAAEARMTILVDGFITSAALLVAHAIAPCVLDYCVFAHASDEAGHRRMLEYFDAAPLLQLGMRLGEGTGAALALPILRAAAAFVGEMASFESAGVSGKSE